MRTQSTDTDPKIERIQIAGFRSLSPGQRFQIANSLTRNAFALSWDNFQRKHALLGENATRLLWVRLLYGDELAQRVSVYLDSKDASPTR